MKKDSVLLLGPGGSWFNRMRSEGLPPGDFDQQFNEVVALDEDPKARATIVWDLNQRPWPLPSGHFDEVHGYEVLEHLGSLGDYRAFFELWKEIWRVTKTGGLLHFSTPWWDSFWALQDPGHRVIYGPGVLSFLDQKQYEKQVGRTTMTDYRGIFPPPYDFEMIKQFKTEPDSQGGSSFMFILRKRGSLADSN